MTTHYHKRLQALVIPLLAAGWSAAADLSSDAAIEHSVLQSPGRACYLHATYYQQTAEVEVSLYGRGERGASWTARLGERPPGLIHAAAMAARTPSRESVQELLERAGWGREAHAGPDGSRLLGYISPDASRTAAQEVGGGWRITRCDARGRRARLACDRDVPARVVAALALTDADDPLEPVTPEFATATELEHLTTALTGAGWSLAETDALVPEDLREAGGSGFHLAILTAPDRAASLIAAWSPAAASTQISDAVEQNSGRWRIEASNLPGHIIAAAALAATTPDQPDRGVIDLLEGAGWERLAPIETDEFAATTWHDPQFTRIVSETFLLGPDGARTSSLWVIERRDIPSDGRAVQANATSTAPAAAIAALALTGAMR